MWYYPMTSQLKGCVSFWVWNGRDGMEQTDVGRRCVVHDRPVGEGNGLIGTIVSVYDDSRFRLRNDRGNEFEFSTSGEMGVKVYFLGDA